VGDVERPVEQPDRRLGAGQAALAVPPPVAVADEATASHAAVGPQAEDAVQVGRVAPGAVHPAQHGGRAAASVGALAMRPVGLLVVIVQVCSGRV